MQAITRGTVAYPKRLDGLGPKAPEQVYIRGGLWSPEPLAVAIVGSRKASESGRKWAYDLGYALAKQHIAVISGGAIGIDGAAHRGVLAGGGRTCAVLAGSVDAPSPQCHRRLFQEVIATGGTLLSEYANPAEKRYLFATRNRLIAALSDVLIIVEARAKSGTLYTCSSAFGLGRTVGYKQWCASDQRGEGGREYVPKGAFWIGSIAEVIDLFGDKVSETLSTSLTEVSDLSPSLSSAQKPMARLISLLSLPTTFEEIRRRLELSESQLQQCLLRAELSGEVHRVGGRWVACRSKKQV